MNPNYAGLVLDYCMTIPSDFDFYGVFFSWIFGIDNTGYTAFINREVELNILVRNK